GCVCAEHPQAERKAAKAGSDFAVCLRLERDVSAEPGAKTCRCCPSTRPGSGSTQAGTTSGVGVHRIELVFRQWPVSQSQLDRNIVKPAWREAAIEMPQSGNDHPDDGDPDVGARLVEHEKIEALARGKSHASHHLLAFIEAAEFGAEIQSSRRIAVRYQIGMVAQMKRLRPVLAGVSHPHETDGEKLIELGQRTQQGDPRVEVRA